MKSLVSRFMRLFQGLDRAYGTYDVSGPKDGSSKLVGKAVTVAKPVTQELWEGHLKGKQGIGIVPINDGGKTSFGAIDVDVYPIDIPEIAKKVEGFSLPLVPVRSKSGGCHLYLFTKDPISAVLMQRKLREFAAALGYGASEIFPKQTRLITERGDAGNWINMPYFGGSVTERYAILGDGRKLSAEEFLDYAEKLVIAEKDLEKLGLRVAEELKDGPPCLEHLLAHGFQPGTRNDGLFNVGVFLRKMNPDSWQKDLEEYNMKYMSPPLSASEVISIAQSLNKKEYGYTCHKPPIKSHCQAAKCRLRKFGVGPSQGMPVLTGLTKYDAQPPIWFLDVEGGGRIELTTEDLQNQARFQRRCMDALNVMTPLQGRHAWQSIIQDLLDNVTVIEVPKDATPVGQLLEHVERFCTSKVQARTRDELLLGKPWFNEGRHYFRMSDLIAYLDRQRFNGVSVSKLGSILKEHGAEHHFFVLKSKGTNCWSMSEFSKQVGTHEAPKVETQDLY